MEKHALSNAQLNILDTELFYQGSAINVVGGVCLFNEAIAEKQLSSALNKLITNNDWLHTRIGGNSSSPYRYVSEYTAASFETLDFTNVSEAEMWSALEEANKAPFDIWDSQLYDVKLVRTPNNKIGYWFKAHHIICDAANMYRIVCEVSSLIYGRENLLPNNVRVRDISPRMKEKAFTYWRDNEITGLESHRPTRTVVADRMTFKLSGDIMKKLSAFAESKQIACSTIVEGAYYLALSALFYKDRFSVGLMYLDDNSACVDGLAGPRASVVPTVTKLDLSLTFAEYCEEILDQHMTAYRYSCLPYRDILSAVKHDSENKKSSLYDFVYSCHALDTSILGDCEIKWLFNGCSEVPLKLSVMPEKDTLNLMIDCRKGVYIDGFTEILYHCILSALNHIFDAPDAQLGALVNAIHTDIHQTEHICKERVCIAASFTADPIDEYLYYWAHKDNVILNLSFAPYNQIQQMLLDPNSIFRNNKNGTNIILMRFEDAIRHTDDSAEARIAVMQHMQKEFTTALCSYPADAPRCLVMCLPFDGNIAGVSAEIVANMNEQIKAVCSKIPNIHYVDTDDLCERYVVHDALDTVADDEGHIPYTTTFFAALGTHVWRQLCAAKRVKKHKVLVVDCDNTLWQGVCGEIGATNVTIQDGYAWFQKFLLAKRGEGYLLAIASKNNPEDVKRVFAENKQMILKESDISAWRVSWNPKTEEIRSIAKELNLGLNSFVFFDDNPVECDAMIEENPEVLTVRMPLGSTQIAPLVGNIWALDSVYTTDEDRNRADMYRAEKEREQARTEEKSLHAYLKKLNIQMYMYSTTPDEIDRVAQLTQRTNQFNMNGVRYLKEDVAEWLQSDRYGCYSVYVKDAYGDYGLVGALVLSYADGKCNLQTFVLSCRVLGREIEIAILNEIANIAKSHGVSAFSASVKRTQKNEPFMRFWQAYVEDNENIVYANFNTPSHITVIKEKYIKPTSQKSNTTASAKSVAHTGACALTTMPSDIQTNDAELKAFIPSCSSEVIAQALGKFIPGQAEGEIVDKVKAVWESVLGLTIDREDASYFELGGDSLKAVHLISILDKELGVRISVSDIYRYATISDMAKYIATLIPKEAAEFEHISTTEPCPLSSAQQRMFVLQSMNRDSVQYNESQAMEMIGPINIERIQNAVSAIISRHDILRTAFTLEQGVPVQTVLPCVNVKIDTISCTEDAWQNEALAFRKPFDLANPPLMRFAALHTTDTDRNFILFDAHHMVIDGTSFAVFAEEFVRLYNGEALPENKYQYIDYVNWENKRKDTPEYESDMAYWVSQFDPMPAPLAWIDDSKRANSIGRGNTLFYTTDSELKQSLENYAGKNQVTLFSVLLSAYALTISSLANANELVVGVPAPNRLHHHTLSMMGNFVNSMPIRIATPADSEISALVKLVFDTTTEALNHQSCPYENIVKALQCDRQNNRNPLFDVMFSLQNFVSPVIETKDMKLVQMPMQVGTSKNDIRLFAALHDDRISFEMEYDTDLFDIAFMESFREKFLSVLELMVTDEAMTAGDITAELQRRQKEADRLFLEKYNDTARPGYYDHLVHDMIREQVEKTPDAIALICGGEKLTYRELDDRSSTLANVLRQKGVRARDKVGIVLPRSPELIIGLLAIMKAGAVYVPADPIYPTERIDYMFGNSEIACVISQNDMELPSGYIRYDIHELENEKAIDQTIEEETIIPDDLIYILYTSGSTGKPKGVMIKHGAVSNFINSLRELIPYEEQSAILATTTVCFDIAVIEMWRTLCFGETIVFATDNERMDMNTIKELIVEYQIQAMNITPTQMSVLLLDDHDDVWKTIKTIMIGGEAVPPSLLEKMQKHIPSARIFDMYGPTETTVYSSIMELTNEAEVTIGFPIANTKLFVIDSEKNILPVGSTGELCIGGAGLSAGYMNRPDLTERQFVTLPENNEFVYRTGDLATLRVDGKMLCHGRIDNQIKIRGYRVELEEIEQSIMKSGLCRECTVFLLDNEHLGAIYTAIGDYSSSDIIDHISGILPHYMVPSKFVKVDNIPLNVNGKADRKKALEIANQTEDEAIEVVTSGCTEDVLLAIFRRITLNNRISVDDSFFEAGGSSLGIFQVLSEIESIFGVKLQYADVYKNMTASGIAAMIEAATDATSGKTLKDFCHKLNEIENAYNIFAFPPIMGYGMSFMYVAKEIKDGTLYAFDFVESEDRVSQYLLQIKQLQKEGPYYILAYSAGAELALDVANELCKGSEVYLVFLDGFYNEISEEKIEDALVDLTQRAIEFIEQTPGDKILYHTIEQKMRHYMEYMIRKEKNALDARVKVHLIFSDSVSEAHINEWEVRFGSKFESRHVQGTHFDMMKKSHAESVAREIDAAFSEFNSEEIG